MSNESKRVTRVRIEYEDGSASEVVGLEDCEWVKLVDAQGGLWATRGWPTPNVRWREIPPPASRQPRENPFFAMIRRARDIL